MRHKVINDAVAYIRGLAQLRGRNADWAEQAVRAAVSLDAEAALKENVIDVVARNVEELLEKIDGRSVSIAGGAELTLDTDKLTVVRIEPDWRSELLAVITNPNVAYILMLVGIYGLIFEFSNPGAIVPGVVGAICLLLALFAFQVLPINYAGVALILLGIALMVGEAFAPSFGILGIGGLVALVFGSIILIDTDAPGFGISPGLIAAVALFSLLLFMAVLGLVMRARRQPVVSGREEMIGAHATVMEAFTGEGLVRAHGELWQASSDEPLTKGQRVRVVGMDGLCLKVAPEAPDKGE
jgi:membrane-bound serine protease (ClpP class)